MGLGIAAGVVVAVIARVIIASRPPGYVVYEGYAAPVYAPAAIGRPGRSTMVRAASLAILACRCKSAPVTRRLRLAMLGARPGMLGARLLAIRSPLHAALPAVRSENRKLSGQRWPASFLSVSHAAERHADVGDGLTEARWPKSFILG
jgi:hypothetical protein